MSKPDYVIPLIPLTYMWILRRAIFNSGKTKSILDVGCGNGSLMQILSYKQNWFIDGIDIYRDYVKIAGDLGIYRKIITGDALNMVNALIKNERKVKYDTVFCSQIIEHLDGKAGAKLLDSLIKLARYRVIVTTTVGYVDQMENHVKMNPYDIHKSGWNTNMFRDRGYRIIGIGPRWLWNRVEIQEKAPKFVLMIFSFVSFLFSPFYYFFPKYSASMVCIKDI